jgi:hypothetical protein
MTADGGNVSSVSEFEAEDKESRKPNERLHGVVGVGKRGGEGGRGEGIGRRLESTTVGFCCRTHKYGSE